MYIHEWVRATEGMRCLGCKRRFDPQEVVFVVFDSAATVFSLFCYDCASRWCRTGESPFRGECPRCSMVRPLHWKQEGEEGIVRGCRSCLWPQDHKPPTPHYDFCVRCHQIRPTVRVAMLDDTDLCMECLWRLAQTDIDAARRQLNLVSVAHRGFLWPP